MRSSTWHDVVKRWILQGLAPRKMVGENTPLIRKKSKATPVNRKATPGAKAETPPPEATPVNHKATQGVPAGVPVGESTVMIVPGFQTKLVGEINHGKLPSGDYAVLLVELEATMI